LCVHLRPTAAIAPLALLPGDPGRALALAQGLLEAPRMANHARGLWGYSGVTSEGLELTIQATGLGGPSTAVVIEELSRLGTAAAVRIGTCEALGDDVPLGTMLVVRSAIAADGASVRLGAGATVQPDAALTQALLAEAEGARGAVVATSDLYYDPAGRPERERWLTAGAIASDLATATALAAGEHLGMAVAAGLVVAGRPGAEALDDPALEDASVRLGRAAARALARVSGGAQDPASGTARLP
jgi:uridine phosphorylase